MSTECFTPEQEQIINNDFHLRMGRVVARWSFVESGLLTWFMRLTSMHPLVARKIFYSQNSGFAARSNMLKAAINSVPTKPDISAYLKAIVDKAGNYAGTRNAIVHGDVLLIGYAGSKYFGQLIILQGRQPWEADPPDNEVLIAHHLDNAAQNFGYLAACIGDGLNWKGETEPEKSPLRLLPLIAELPNPAHTSQLDPNSAAQPLLAQLTVPNWWR